MRPEFWIGIGAIAGSVAGVLVTLAFGGEGALSAGAGTAIGAGMGTAIYVTQRGKDSPDDQSL